jgi:hypothetical protein
MPATQLIYPMAAHVGLAALLYAALTLVRAPKVWGIGGAFAVAAAWAKIEPRISANLSNQFEWPVFFYAICVLQIAMVEPVSNTFVYLAWLFIAGRLIHSGVQIFSANVRLRGAVFTINFLAVIAMWAIFLSSMV